MFKTTYQQSVAPRCLDRLLTQVVSTVDELPDPEVKIPVENARWLVKTNNDTVLITILDNC